MNTATRFAVGACAVLILIAVLVVLMAVLWAERGGDPGDPAYTGFDTDEDDEAGGWSEVDEAALNQLLQKGHDL